MGGGHHGIFSAESSLAAGLLGVCLLLLASCGLVFSPTPVSLTPQYLSVYGSNHSYGEVQGGQPLPCGSSAAFCVGGFYPSGTAGGNSTGLTSVNYTASQPPGWADPIGASAYDAAIDSSGNLFTGYVPQTNNQLLATGTQMQVSVLSTAASSPVDHLLAVPTLQVPGEPTWGSGATSVGAGYSGQGGLGGADVSGIGVVPDTASQSGQAADFVSAVPYGGWNAQASGVFPTFGRVVEQNGTWQTSGLESAAAIASSGYGGVVDPNSCVIFGNGQPCSPTNTSGELTYAEEACPAGQPLYYGVNSAGGPVGSVTTNQCRGPASMAVLPASGNLVVGQYFPAYCPSCASAPDSGGIMALSPAGTLLGEYQPPNVFRDAQGDLVARVGVRSVVAVPPGAAAGAISGSEVFAAVYDSTGTYNNVAGSALQFPVQLFSFDSAAIGSSTTNPISPLTEPFVPADLTSTGITRGGFEAVAFDRQGDLWGSEVGSEPAGGSVPTSGPGIDAWSLAGARSACPLAGAGAAATLGHFGAPCSATKAFSADYAGSSTPFGLAPAITCDCAAGATGDMLVVANGTQGALVPFSPGASLSQWSEQLAWNLGLPLLTDRHDYVVQTAAAVVDQANRRVWLPVGTFELSTQINTANTPTFVAGLDPDGVTSVVGTTASGTGTDSDPPSPSGSSPPDETSDSQPVAEPPRLCATSAAGASCSVTINGLSLTCQPACAPVTLPQPVESIDLKTVLGS